MAEERLEIIVTTRDDLNKPRKVRFEELYDIRENLASVMLLWDMNSYYVDSLSKTFVVNGGRRVVFDKLDGCAIVYRRRNSQTVSLTGGNSKTSTAWIIGVQESKEGKMAALKITDEGSTWQWIDSL